MGERGIPKAAIESLGALYRDIEFPDPKGDIAVMRRNAAIWEQQNELYAMQLAMQRLLDNKEESDAKVAEFFGTSNSGDRGRPKPYSEY